MKKVFGGIGIVILMLAISIGSVELITWGICACFGWKFTFLIGFGIWLIMFLVHNIIRGATKSNTND